MKQSPKIQRLYQIEINFQCKLLRNLYSFKQYGRQWNQNIIVYTKELGKIKIIIRQQIHQDIVSEIIKISQTAFIQELDIEEKFSQYNANMISMKTNSAMKITQPKDSKKDNLCTYYYVMSKLIYLACETRPNMFYTIKQLSRYTLDLKRSSLYAIIKVAKQF